VRDGTCHDGAQNTELNGCGLDARDCFPATVLFLNIILQHPVALCGPGSWYTLPAYV
jgi:hypothetical protein